MQRQPILTDRDLSLFELKTRFVRNYLTFAGKNSKDFLLYISGPGVYDSPEADVELTSVPGKNGDIIRENAFRGRLKNVHKLLAGVMIKSHIVEHLCTAVEIPPVVVKSLSPVPERFKGACRAFQRIELGICLVRIFSRSEEPSVFSGVLTVPVSSE